MFKSRAEYETALKEAHKLERAEPGTLEGDRLMALVPLIEAYEEEHFFISAPDPIDAILFMMEQQCLTRRDLEPAIGPRGRVSDVLNRRRPLTISMIRSLVKLLQIPANVLIQEYDLLPVKPRRRTLTPA